MSLHQNCELFILLLYVTQQWQLSQAKHFFQILARKQVYVTGWTGYRFSSVWDQKNTPHHLTVHGILEVVNMHGVSHTLLCS